MMDCLIKKTKELFLLIVAFKSHLNSILGTYKAMKPSEHFRNIILIVVMITITVTTVTIVSDIKKSGILLKSIYEVNESY
jgi:hypothetical protein